MYAAYLYWYIFCGAMHITRETCMQYNFDGSAYKGPMSDMLPNIAGI